MLAAAELHRLAQDGALLLAPNLRTGRQLRARLTAQANGPAEAAMLSSRVLHWRSWTASLWREAILGGRDGRVLLQPLQERLLWEQVLTETGVDPTTPLLDLCISAAALLYQHGAVPALLSSRGDDLGTDRARFAQWFRTFQRRCAEALLLPDAALEAALTGHAGAFAAPATLFSKGQALVLCGLAGLSPAQQGLLDALNANGTAVLDAPHQPTTPSSATLIVCRDDADELQVLLQRLALALQSSQRPDIAVVVPDLSSTRDRIDRALREHLPSTASPFQDDRRLLWEFSIGRPLASAGVIADALHLLTWTTRELNAEEISLLLRSPHLDWPIDAETAASLDAALLRRYPHLRGTWSPRSAAQLLQESSATLARTLLERTRSWQGLHGATGSFHTFAERARHILRDFGWFRSEHRSSGAFQAAKRWQDLLDAIAALDLVGGNPPTWAAFVHRLTAAARLTTFAPENTGAPIQLLTPDESTGVEAAELWVLHADEDRWNSRAAAHPLLSWSLQQRFGMPGTDPALDQRQLCEQLGRVAGIAPLTTFTYARTGESGERRPSSAIAALPSLEMRQADPSGVLGTMQASAPLHIFDDGPLIPLAVSDDPRPIPGGVSVLQSQAACAFRAFAERRLNAATVESRDLGLDARDRGSVLHNALQIFWQGTRNSDTLHRLIAEDRLSAAIHRAVDLALQNTREGSDRWSEAYLEVQRIRLRGLLDRWLRLEATRPRFEVAALEREMTVTVGGLPLTVRVDRVDRVALEDGRQAHVILDYKTGQPAAKKWEGDRPDEPQLPLYATFAMPEFTADAMPKLSAENALPVGAIAFGIVRAGDKLHFVSAPRNSVWLSPDAKKAEESLDTDLGTWRETLETLAHDFSDGIAAVGPKEYPSTCRFCEQRLLCRLNPALLDVEDPAEVDA